MFAVRCARRGPRHGRDVFHDSTSSAQAIGAPLSAIAIGCGKFTGRFTAERNKNPNTQPGISIRFQHKAYTSCR